MNSAAGPGLIDTRPSRLAATRSGSITQAALFHPSGSRRLGEGSQAPPSINRDCRGASREALIPPRHAAELNHR